MRISTRWHEHAALMGDQDGVDMGRVTIYLGGPVEHRQVWTVPSAAVTIAAEAGNVTALELVLPDGRRAIIPAANVLGIVDAAEESAE
jgi:hypothetical protein